MKYVLAFSEETEHLDSNLFDTLEDAEKTAKKVIKLYNEKGYTVVYLSQKAPKTKFDK